MRQKRICVTETEKQRLESIRTELFGSDSVPLGEVLGVLMDEFERADQTAP